MNQAGISDVGESDVRSLAFGDGMPGSLARQSVVLKSLYMELEFMWVTLTMQRPFQKHSPTAEARHQLG